MVLEEEDEHPLGEQDRSDGILGQDAVTVVRSMSPNANGATGHRQVFVAGHRDQARTYDANPAECHGPQHGQDRRRPLGALVQVGE